MHALNELGARGGSVGDRGDGGRLKVSRVTISSRAEPTTGIMQMVAKNPLNAVLADPARTPIDGALPVLTVREEDDLEYQDALRRVEGSRHALIRRGTDHGTVVEILRPDLAPKPSEGTMHRCWKAARPFVMRGVVPCAADGIAGLPEQWAGDDEAEAAARWLLDGCDGGSRVAADVDPERDIVKVHNDTAKAWVKLGRLSTAQGDDSRRLCFGVGEEVQDDDHPDADRHAAAFEWAAARFPDLSAIAASEVFAAVGRARRAAVVPSNPIVYWNRPNGGALFHHDALPGYLPRDVSEGAPTPVPMPVPMDGAPRRPGAQRGVVFVQGAGSTVWIAISIADLAMRCCEFIEEIVEGAAPWMFEEFVQAGVWDPMYLTTREPERAVEELQHPDAGALLSLVHGSLEFTGFLIDSGHGCVLHPADAIVLPNPGPGRTAMHSVYCGSPGPNVGYSLGLRDAPQPA